MVATESRGTPSFSTNSASDGHDAMIITWNSASSAACASVGRSARRSRWLTSRAAARGVGRARARRLVQHEGAQQRRDGRESRRRRRTAAACRADRRAGRRCSGPHRLPAARALCRMASARPTRGCGVLDESSATAAGKTPLTAPCSPRQPSSASGEPAKPMPTVAMRDAEHRAHHHRLVADAIGERAPDRGGEHGDHERRRAQDAGPVAHRVVLDDADVLQVERDQRQDRRHARRGSGTAPRTRSTGWRAPCAIPSSSADVL